MRVESVRAITGANVYCHQPVIVARLDLGKLKDKRSRDAAGFNNRLLEKFPGLREHCCECGRGGGFVERLEEGTYFNHVVEHIAFEMLAQAGLERRDVKFCGADERDVGRAVIKTTVVEAARFLLSIAAEIVEAILEEKFYAFEDKIIEAKIIAAGAELGPRERAIVEAAEKRGIPWTRTNENSLIQLGYGKNLRFVPAAGSDEIIRAADQSASSKNETERREPRDVGGAVIEMLYPAGAPSRIPIVAITGTNGKTTVTRMTAHILLETGVNVGATTTDGILFNGESIFVGDTTGPASAKKILGDKAVDIAVLETARGGILRRGLGWDWADVGVVTNITEDHIGQDGIESVADLVNIKALIAERVRENGTLVLNADDAESANLINRPAVRRIKKKIVYFALSEENPIIKAHLEAGETVYYARDNWICERRGAAILQIADVTAIPITMNGTADFQIQNAMAAIAASRALGLSPEKISNALGEFRGEVHNPGRNNLYRVGAGYVLIDYGHNPKALEAICKMTSRWTGKTITGIISFPGDRRDDVIEAAGRIAVAGFDRIIIKGDINLRGRESGEVAEMLCRLVLEAGNQSDCKIVLDAAQAFEEAIAEIKENEVVIFFYEKLAPALATLKKYGAKATTTY
jgi:UDP-N-acetylmuramyl tripeptide synthase